MIRPIRAVLISAAGPAFTVGGDLEHFGRRIADLDVALAEVIPDYHRTLARLAALEVPVVAAVQGAIAGGGLGLAWIADLVLAADDSVFATGFARLGLSGDGGCTWFLPRLVGLRRAQEMEIGGRVLTAAGSARLGPRHPGGPGGPISRPRPRRSSRGSRPDRRSRSAAMRRLLRESWGATLEQQLDAESAAITRSARSADAREGITAFAARRPPRFTGRKEPRMIARTDVLVIGAGVGGLCAAARLAHHGRKVVVVESRDRVGGRASTVDVDGFKVNTGAIAIEYGGVMEETFRLVGAPWDLRVPSPATLFRIKGRDVDLSKGGWGLLVNGVTKHGARLLDSLGSARRGELPDEQLSTKAWLAKVTSNETLHAVFRNLCAAIFAVNSDELPPRPSSRTSCGRGVPQFRLLSGRDARAHAGARRRGHRARRRGLARERGGDAAGRGWRVRGAVVRRGGSTIECRDAVVEIAADTVISNAGPARTVALAGREHFAASYLARMDRDLAATANIVVNVASRAPLLAAPGIVTFGITRRLCNMANLTATCPELAPPGVAPLRRLRRPDPGGRRLRRAGRDRRDAAGSPRRAPGFADARILSIAVMRGEWPAQRSIAGLDLPQETSLANLWNVGDGVREYASGGTQACAETAAARRRAGAWRGTERR